MTLREAETIARAVADRAREAGSTVEQIHTAYYRAIALALTAAPCGLEGTTMTTARVIPISSRHPKSPRARLEKAIALSVEMRELLKQGFGIAPDLIEGAEARVAGVEVGLRSTLAVLNAGPGPEAA